MTWCLSVAVIEFKIGHACALPASTVRFRCAFLGTEGVLICSGSAGYMGKSVGFLADKGFGICNLDTMNRCNIFRYNHVLLFTYKSVESRTKMIRRLTDQKQRKKKICNLFHEDLLLFSVYQ